MDQLQINLLGGFTVVLNQQPIAKFRSAKSRALLAYLAAQPDREYARSTLATLLWGDLPESAAKTNLRIELSNLHKLLGEHPALVIERNSVCFQPAQATVDVIDFQRSLTTFRALPSEVQRTQLGRLEAAVETYRGEFLSGFTVADAVEFDDWRLLVQEQLHEQAMGALNLLQQHYAEQGHWAELANAAHRQLTFVPWLEGAHRNLIQALAAQGQREAALAQYDRCVALLQAEMGVEPALATQEIAARLRANSACKVAGSPNHVRHNLPQQLKTLVGRTAEIEQVYNLVQQEQLVTLLGLGGVGKSRLAQAVGQKALHDFADGVWFVPLATIEANATTADRIALAIAAAIGFAITDLQSPLSQLSAHLADKEVLLILDNWDQITDAAEALCEQLLVHSGVFILATSRVRLLVESEVLVPLSGLLPDQAFALFVERARRLVPNFAPADQVAQIEQVCAAVGGLPLGIELAASWVEHMRVAEIAHSLAEIAIEPTEAARHVDRHQTLHAVFEYSWRLLSAQQQQILARLSVFRGGFDRAAAAAVAGSQLSDLSLLLAHSLVQRIGAGRYDLHPLVQEFAARKLDGTAEVQISAAHRTYYLPLLASTKMPQRTPLRIDFDNIRSAWQSAVLALDGALVEPSLVPFGEFIAQYGGMADGNALLSATIERFAALPDQQELVAQLLNQQTNFLRALAGLPAIAPLQQRILALTQKPALQITAHLDLANHYAEQGEWAQADHHFDQAEALTQASSDLGAYITMVEERIHVNAIHFRGDFAQGIKRLEEMLQLFDQATTPIQDAETTRMYLLRSLTMLTLRHRDYELSLRYARQTLALVQQLDLRQRYSDALLDLALAEQFAGLYAQAVAHNQSSLAIAEEISDVDQVALLHANLCLTLRQCGELAAALEYGLAAIESLRTLGNRRIEGQARNRVGHTLLAMARWCEAEQAYCEALVVWAPTQHPNRYEAVAGLAMALLQLGRLPESLPLAQDVLDFVEVNGLVGIVEPVLLLLNCATVFSGCGEPTQASEALQKAADWVEMVASRIRDEVVLNAFLQRPDVQQLAQKRCV